MTPRTRIAVLLVGVALAVAGCATSTSTSGSPGPGAAPTPTATNSSGCPMTLTITADDSDKTVCVGVGGTVIVDLTSADGSRWQPLDIGGNVLTQKGTPASDSTGSQKATLAATSVGTATIASGRRACPSSPGTVSCHAIIAWMVTIDVKS